MIKRALKITGAITTAKTRKGEGRESIFSGVAEKQTQSRANLEGL